MKYEDCVKCEYAIRDSRGRFVRECYGYSNCDFSEYKGVVDMSEEEKDKLIKDLTDRLEVAEGTKTRLTIFDRLDIVSKTEKRVAKDIIDLIINSFPYTTNQLISAIQEKYKLED